MSMLTVDDTANEGSDEQAENAPADDDVDPDFGNKELGAFTYDSGVVLVPIELLQDSEVDLAAEILALASERIGAKLNKRTTLGSGTGQPQGFVTGATVGKDAASATAITYDELLDLLHSVPAPYRRRGGRWQFNDQTLAAIRKLKDGDNRYIFTPGSAGSPNQVLGYDYVVNPAMDDIAAGKKPIAFGDFSRYRVRFVANPFVRRLEEAYATRRQVGFYIAQRADGRLTDAKAVAVLEMAPGT
jgi:HK97 family phage major capsid protein